MVSGIIYVRKVGVYPRDGCHYRPIFQDQRIEIGPDPQIVEMVFIIWIDSGNGSVRIVWWFVVQTEVS